MAVWTLRVATMVYFVLLYVLHLLNFLVRVAHSLSLNFYLVRSHYNQPYEFGIKWKPC